MFEKKTFEEYKHDIKTQLEHLAVLRRVGIDLEFDADEIDKYIAEEGARQVKKFEEKSEVELMIFMLNDILENAPDEIKTDLNNLL